MSVFWTGNRLTLLHLTRQRSATVLVRIYVEGRNLQIKERWAEGHDERLPGMAADLVRQRVALIMCAGSPGATLAAKAANVTTVAALLNLKHPTGVAGKHDLENATRSMGLKLHILSADSESEIDAAFAALPALNAGALLVGADPFFHSKRRQIVALVARAAISRRQKRSG